MNNRQSLLAGAIIGLASITAVFALYSTLANASAQMMQHQGVGMGAMDAGMTTTGNTSQPHNGMFSGSGSSAVKNVQVTGIAVTADKEASVYLRYTGTGQAPGVVIVAHTNKMGMMSMMHGGMMGMSGMGGMQDTGMMMGPGTMMGGMSAMSGSNSYPAWTDAQWQQWHTQMAQELVRSNSTHRQDWHAPRMNPTWLNSTTATMPQDSGIQVGSTAVNAGWKNGTFKVKLEGDGSAYNSNDIMTMVFPLTG